MPDKYDCHSLIQQAAEHHTAVGLVPPQWDEGENWGEKRSKTYGLK